MGAAAKVTMVVIVSAPRAGAVPAQGCETAAEQQCHECCGDQHEADAEVLHLRVAVFHAEYGAHEGEADGGDAGVYGCHRG